MTDAIISFVCGFALACVGFAIYSKMSNKQFDRELQAIQAEFVSRRALTEKRRAAGLWREKQGQAGPEVH